LGEAFWICQNIRETEMQKTDHRRSVFCRHLLKKLHPAVPTGIETAKCNYFPTDFKLILRLFIIKDRMILHGGRGDCQAINGAFC
jgi:hypothetical protein